MPLDVALAVETRSPLEAALAERDITPVSPEALHAHKRAQLRHFRPSFWYRNRLGLALALLLSVASLGVAAGLGDRLSADAQWLPLDLAVASMVLLAGAIASGMFRLAAGPQWEERRVPISRLRRASVPEPIAAVAESLRSAVPGSALILGELVQRAEVLDPYLLIEHEGEQVCLGIWDKSGILCRAS
jgi:hypothetical protein